MPIAYIWATICSPDTLDHLSSYGLWLPRSLVNSECSLFWHDSSTPKTLPLIPLEFKFFQNTFPFVLKQFSRCLYFLFYLEPGSLWKALLPLRRSNIQLVNISSPISILPLGFQIWCLSSLFYISISRPFYSLLCKHFLPLLYSADSLKIFILSLCQCLQSYSYHILIFILPHDNSHTVLSQLLKH